MLDLFLFLSLLLVLLETLTIAQLKSGAATPILQVWAPLLGFTGADGFEAHQATGGYEDGEERSHEDESDCPAGKFTVVLSMEYFCFGFLNIFDFRPHIIRFPINSWVGRCTCLKNFFLLFHKEVLFTPFQSPTFICNKQLKHGTDTFTRIIVPVILVIIVGKGHIACLSHRSKIQKPGLSPPDFPPLVDIVFFVDAGAEGALYCDRGLSIAVRGV